jgi:hypothetical protein
MLQAMLLVAALHVVLRATVYNTQDVTPRAAAPCSTVATTANQQAAQEVLQIATANGDAQVCPAQPHCCSGFKARQTSHNTSFQL